LQNQKSMEGKKVLVTGAGTGIGRGVALEFGKEGADVVLHYWPRAEGADSAVREIAALGGKSKAIKADFRQLEALKNLASEAVDFLGGLDVLINNSGITANVPFELVTPELFDTLYNVNIRAMFFLTQAVLPALTKQGRGAVINLASVHAFSGMTEHSVYAGTKGAIVAFTREVALELIQKGVRVNAIAPGWIFTEGHRAMLGDDFDVKIAGKSIPAGFIGQPSDIGRLAVFLASEESRYIVGQTIVCDGGQSAIMPLTGDFREPRKERWGVDYVEGLKKIRS
jgi:NAD(P)-dependent dehydrogenase (short-subunit alcohol dehydrogenase family)